MDHEVSIIRIDSHPPLAGSRSGSRRSSRMVARFVLACVIATLVALLVAARVRQHRARAHDQLPAAASGMDEGEDMPVAAASGALRLDHLPPAGAPTEAPVGAVDPPADLYVSNSGSDANPGGAAAPFRTLQHAADVVKAGQTVRVRAGRYVGMNFYRGSGGAPGRPIRFLADPGVVINTSAKAGPNSDSGINLEAGKGWFVFSGFHIVNEDDSMERACIRVAGNSNTQLLRNTCEKPGTWGIIVGTSNDLLIQGNLCVDAGREHGLYVGRGSNRVTVRGNIFRGNKGDGFHLNGGADGPIDEAVVDGNAIVGNQLSGIDADGVVNGVFRNNLVYGNGKHAVSLYNTDTRTGCSGNLFLNNTLVSTRMFAILMRPGSTANRLYNNILVQASERREYGSIGASGTPKGLISDYNLVVDRFSADLGATRLTLTQWSDLTGQDGHSIVSTADRVFVDAAGDDYRLRAGAPATGVGTSAARLRELAGTDILGTARPADRGVDLGAYQHHLGPR